MTSSYSILIADDDAQVRAFVVRAVLWIVPHAQVTVAVNGTEALAALHQSLFDLVITDFQMPGANGFDVAAAARSRNVQVPIMLITANQIAVQGAAVGVDYVLTKPFLFDDLTAVIRTLLHMP